MSTHNKLLLISDEVIEISNNLLIYKQDSRYGIVYLDTLIEAKYDSIYAIGKSIALIDTLKGNLVVLEENGTIHRFTYKAINKNILKLLNKDYNNKNIINTNKNMGELVLKYAIAFELNINIKYHIQTKFNNTRIEKLAGLPDKDKYCIAVRYEKDYIEIRVKYSNRGEFSLIKSLYDTKLNNWIINVLELSTTGISTDNMYTNSYYNIIYFFTKSDKKVTNKMVINKPLRVYNIQDKLGIKYKLFGILNNVYGNLLLYNKLFDKIEQVMTIRVDTEYIICENGTMLLKLAKKDDCINELVDEETYNKAIYLNRKYNNGRNNCYLIISLFDKVIYNKILIKDSIYYRGNEKVILIDVFGNKEYKLINSETGEFK